MPKCEPLTRSLRTIALFLGLLIGLPAVGCNAPVTQSEPPPLAAIEAAADLSPTVQPLPTSAPITQIQAPDAEPPTVVPATLLPSTTVPPTAIPATIVPTIVSAEIDPEAPVPDDTWQLLAPGLEQRALPVTNAAGQVVELLYILRVDQNNYRFDVGYSPGNPKTMPTWLIETGALAVMNASFFTPEYYATGLTIVDGQASGASYDFGGMVVIRDGRVSLQGLSAEPYSPDGSIDAGLQAFPLLVNRDGNAAFTEPSVNRARRTAIGEDQSGRILLMIADRPWFTLTELSYFLASSDLDLSLAFNLDGGPSSSLLLREPELSIASPVLLPAILTLNKR